MRVIVLGGTRFVGRALVAELVSAGHEPLVVHRGHHEPRDGPEIERPHVEHLHVDRRRLAERREELVAFGAQAAIDFSVLTGADATTVLDVLAELSPPPQHDTNRREEFVLRRVRAGRRRMPIGPGAFLVSRGYAPELARGLRLAIEAGSTVAGETLNLCETTCAPLRLWAEQIVQAAGAELDLVDVPTSALPADLALTGDIAQHLLADPSRAARRIGWVHAPPEALVRRSTVWHLAHPPDPDEQDRDFTADDRALAAGG